MVSSRFVSLFLCFLCFEISVSSIRLPGVDKEAKATHGSGLGLNKGVCSVKFDPTRVTQLSWNPRAFLYKGFLKEEECDHVIALVRLYWLAILIVILTLLMIGKF